MIFSLNMVDYPVFSLLLSTTNDQGYSGVLWAGILTMYFHLDPLKVVEWVASKILVAPQRPNFHSLFGFDL